MIYYHITDSYLEERILREGLIGNPVVYLTDSVERALCIRLCQLMNKEKIHPATIFQVAYEGEVFVDPDTSPLDTAWMVYDDISPNKINVFYPSPLQLDRYYRGLRNVKALEPEIFPSPSTWN